MVMLLLIVDYKYVGYMLKSMPFGDYMFKAWYILSVFAITLPFYQKLLFIHVVVIKIKALLPIHTGTRHSDFNILHSDLEF